MGDFDEPLVKCQVEQLALDLLAAGSRYSNSFNGEEELSAYYAIVRAAQSKISEIKGCHNARTIAATLPDEVLGDILHRSANMAPRRRYHTDLGRFRLVCVRWNHVIKGTVENWSTIFHRANRDMWQMSLEYSKASVLYISSELGLGDYSNLNYDLLLPHVHRCRRLDLRLHDVPSLPSAADLVRRATQQLTEISLCGYKDMGILNANPVIDVIDSSELRIQVLRLSEISGLRPGHWASHICSLSLKSSSIILETFLDVLDSTRLLRDLSLEDVEIVTPFILLFSDEPASRITTLESLSELVVVGGMLDVAVILAVIRAPRCTRTLFYSRTFHPFTEFQTLIYTFLEHQLPSHFLSSENKSITLKFSGFLCNAWKRHEWESPWSFEFDVNPDEVPWYEAIVNLLHPELCSQCTSLRIVPMVQSLCKFSLTQVGELFPNITSITMPFVFASYSEWTPKLRRLQRVPGPDDAVSFRWLFPLATDWTLTGRWTALDSTVRLMALRGLLNIVKGRSNPGAPAVRRINKMDVDGPFHRAGKEERLLVKLEELVPDYTVRGVP